MNIEKKYEDEINYKDVVKSPIRWFGLVYIYFIVLIIAAGLYYVDYMSSAFRNSVDPLIADSTNVRKNIEIRKGSISEGVDITALAANTDGLLSNGEQLYKGNCVSCHGDQGKGNGIAGAALNPKPRDFTAKDGWVNGRTFSGMFKTIKEGIASSGMPSYDYLSVEDRVALIHYIRNLAGNHPKIENTELTLLDQNYNLSEGAIIPPQIPVELSMKRISEDNFKYLSSLKLMKLNFKEINNDTNYIFVKKYIDDFDKAIEYLAKDDYWQESLTNFKNSISKSKGFNGFSSSFINLSNNEWDKIYNFFKDLTLTKMSNENV